MRKIIIFLEKIWILGVLMIMISGIMDMLDFKFYKEALGLAVIVITLAAVPSFILMILKDIGEIQDKIERGNNE